MFDERYAVYLYIIDLRTELDRLGFLASDDGTYIMTVNADDAVTDFPPFKHFLFSFKAFNEGIRLKDCIRMQQKLMNVRVRCVAADSIYANNANRKFCILLTFAPNSTDLVSLPLTMGRT